MMFKLIASAAFIFAIISLSFADAQVVRDTTFVPVSSKDVGCEKDGCLVAAIVSSLASLDNPRIGTDRTRIINAINTELSRSRGTFPYPTYDVINAAINFLRTVL